jgi:deoxyhypusine synthase
MAAIQGVNFEALLAAGATSGAAANAVLDAAATTGLQATAAHSAEAALAAMRRLKEADPEYTIVLTYTSNMISCGLRECFAWLAEHRWVDVAVTTAGGVEEDVIKCLGKTIVGDFALPGAALRADGMNRVGNLLIPNDNYVGFEDFYVPVLRQIHAEQRKTGGRAASTPSEMIQIMGDALSASALPTEPLADSFVHQCSRAKVPLFCPALTDGSMGDMIFFYNFKNPGLVVDPVLDAEALEARLAGRKVGVIVLGGGLPKHHALRAIANAAGAAMTHLVMVTTGSEADGCVSGTSLRDDASDGLLGVSRDTTIVKVQGEATLVVPTMIARTFAK